MSSAVNPPEAEGWTATLSTKHLSTKERLALPLIVADDVKKSCTNRYCIMRCFCAVELKLLNQIRDPEVLYDRLREYWINLGLIAALIGTMFYSSFAAPPKCDATRFDDCNFQMIGVLGFCQYFAIGCGMSSSIAATLNYQYLNTIPKSMTRDWAIQMLWVLPMPMMWLIGCLGFGVLSVVLLSYILYGALMGFIALMLVSGTIVTVWVILMYLHCKTKNYIHHVVEMPEPDPRKAEGASVEIAGDVL